MWNIHILTSIYFLYLLDQGSMSLLIFNHQYVKFFWAFTEKSSRFPRYESYGGTKTFLVCTVSSLFKTERFQKSCTDQRETLFRGWTQPSRQHYLSLDVSPGSAVRIPFVCCLHFLQPFFFCLFRVEMKITCNVGFFLSRNCL